MPTMDITYIYLQAPFVNNMCVRIEFKMLGKSMNIYMKRTCKVIISAV